MEHAVAIPKAGHKSPETENLPVAAKSNELDQSSGNQQLMSLEVALVRALQELVSQTEN
jgi:hypothetical protein